MALWSLRGVLSNFKLSSNLFFEHIDRKLKGFHLKFHVFFLSFFMNDVDLKASKWNGSPSMKIHEIFGWNKINPWNVVHSALKIIQIPWMNVHEHSPRILNDEWMKFHWWNFMDKISCIKVELSRDKSSSTKSALLEGTSLANDICEHHALP
jgi:hypothetical protein